ncbi:FkbM family methyltransferase [Shewanella sp.]|uniref:FkbM family methyltransferase n=1 Tax=Shewanella sp. TaxID=50422 RepID=UPI003A9825A8
MDKTTNQALSTTILANLQWPSPVELLSQLNDVIVFGTGGAAECVTRVLDEYGVNILYYVDNSLSKQQQDFHGKQVLTPNQLDKSSATVLIASYWAKDIATQLVQLGVKYLDFSFFVDFQRWKDHFNCQIFDVESAVAVANKYLTEEDLHSFLGCIRYRQTYDPLCLTNPSHEHYLSKVVAVEASDIYIDGGAWQGDTVLDLKALCGNELEIHSFEPDESNCKILKENIAKQELSNCFVVKKALWNQKSTLQFVTSNEAVHSMQSRVSVTEDSQQVTEVPTTTLDDYCLELNRHPTYLKLDIEGAEPQAIEGAKNLLRNHGPKLAISAYHEPNQLWQLIEQISEYNPNYKFWFVHHSQQLFESVIYAMVKN